MTDKPLPRPDADIETDVRAIIRSREGLRDDEPVWSDLAVRALLRRRDALRVAAPATPTEDPRAGTTCADCGHTFEAHLLGVVCCDCVGFLAATEQPETDEVWGQNPNTGNHGRRR
jgi:hypothetical protein